MEISATRMNLLLKREEVSSASIGAELLRSKRDVLTAEFFSTIRPLMALRDQLDEQASHATKSLILALGIEGREKLRSHSFIDSESISLQVNYKNLLGLKVPELAIDYSGNEKMDNSIGIDSAKAAIIETKNDFRDFLNLALRILPQELKLKRLGREIKETTRKVNSLEKYVIPRLFAQVKFIREALEEREREDIFRLKRLKKRAPLT